ncbi:MAG: serine hydrolase [Elusimicrobia bacterium]|nr:serine hydrolase [Elusimicrobiota bacterium]
MNTCVGLKITIEKLKHSWYVYKGMEKAGGIAKKSLVLAAVFAVTSASTIGVIHLIDRWSRPRQEPVKAAAISDPRWTQLTAELESTVARYPGRVGVYLKDLNSDRIWSHQPDQLMPSASLIKVPIMAAVLKKVEEGEISLEENLTVTRKTRAGGSGRLKWARAGSKFTVAELLYYLITESDNTAMRLLIARLGLDYFQNAFSELGLLATNIENEGLKLSSRPVLKENYTTAREMAELLEKIYEGQLVTKESSGIMLELMKHLKHRERLARTLPSGWQIAHKTGLLRRACHDAGIVFSPSGDYVLVVLTWKGPDYRTAKRYISYLGQVTYRYYSGESDLATSYPRSRVQGI